jgi:hypothetical protein
MGHLTAIVQQEQSGFAGGVVASIVPTVDAIGIIRIAIAVCTGARTSPALMKTANIWRTSFMRLTWAESCSSPHVQSRQLSVALRVR